MSDLAEMSAPSRADLEKAAEAFFHGMIADNSQPRPLDEEFFHEDLSFQLEECGRRIGELDSQLIQNLFDTKVGVRADELIRICGLPPAAVEPRLAHYAAVLSARVEREQLAYFRHQLTAPHKAYRAEDELFASIPRASRPHPRAEISEWDGLSLERLTAAFLDWKRAQGVGHSQLEEISRALSWLSVRMGAQRLASHITKDELRTFRTDLTRLKSNLRGRPVPFEKRLTDLRAQQIKSETAGRYWQSVQSMFAWAVSEGLLSDDVSIGLKVAKRKDEKRHSPEAFTTAELEALFKTPLFAGHLSESRVITPGDCRGREGRWWSALLFLHTGLRASELAQLLPSDFVLNNPVPHVLVRCEDESGKLVKTTKNEASIRSVPLAPVLFDLGLAQFVSSRSRKPSLRVFREFNLGKGRSSDGLTKFWARYLKAVGLHVPGRSTHVWRHTVVARLRAAGAAEEDIQAFIGHTRNTVTARYGGEYPLSRKAGMLEHLDFGIDLVELLGGAFNPKVHS